MRVLSSFVVASQGMGVIITLRHSQGLSCLPAKKVSTDVKKNILIKQE
jgi:hypothetical protein